MTNLNKKTENAIVKILTDDIIYTRIEDALFRLHNAFNPSNSQDIDSKFTYEYSGYSTAFDILGIDKHDELAEILGIVTYEMKQASNESADVLASKIYHNWLNEIKNYFLTQKQVA